jgi:Domain of Unknown Function (DUF928)
MTRSLNQLYWIELFLSVVLIQAVPVYAQSPTGASNFTAPPPPVDIGEPGQRAGAGSRRTCGEQTAQFGKGLTALVPLSQAGNSTGNSTGNSEVVFGITSIDRPTFWFYTSYQPPFAGTFVLQDQTGAVVYESPVTLPETRGVIRLSLPNTVAALQVDRPYHWFLKIYCQSQSPPDSFVDGWIQRKAISPTLQNQLANATPQEQVTLYANNGIWFEALSTAAELHRANPNDLNWAELLRSIGLQGIASATIH